MALNLLSTGYYEMLWHLIRISSNDHSLYFKPSGNARIYLVLPGWSVMPLQGTLLRKLVLSHLKRMKQAKRNQESTSESIIYQRETVMKVMKLMTSQNENGRSKLGTQTSHMMAQDLLVLSIRKIRPNTVPAQQQEETTQATSLHSVINTEV
ncbi:hypothetical protein NA56DRAFT_264084 [Hyaloscypha hepaticicola]|uniref:Uncharacterized protein n=1 Tax=Hyaloscypha hepaticicola TaxID=2082293 RepID=A0A2J6PUI6_9HELO|nr:hypothetical protein NA56DRAFT_264084 [Hyaloscypha hepaticicola]